MDGGGGGDWRRPPQFHPPPSRRVALAVPLLSAAVAPALQEWRQAGQAAARSLRSLTVWRAFGGGGGGSGGGAWGQSGLPHRAPGGLHGQLVWHYRLLGGGQACSSGGGGSFEPAVPWLTTPPSLTRRGQQGLRSSSHDYGRARDAGRRTHPRQPEAAEGPRRGEGLCGGPCSPQRPSLGASGRLGGARQEHTGGRGALGSLPGKGRCSRLGYASVELAQPVGIFVWVCRSRSARGNGEEKGRCPVATLTRRGRKVRFFRSTPHCECQMRLLLFHVRGTQNLAVRAKHRSGGRSHEPREST